MLPPFLCWWMHFRTLPCPGETMRGLHIRRTLSSYTPPSEGGFNLRPSNRTDPFPVGGGRHGSESQSFPEALPFYGRPSIWLSISPRRRTALILSARYKRITYSLSARFASFVVSLRVSAGAVCVLWISNVHVSERREREKRKKRTLQVASARSKLDQAFMNSRNYPSPRTQRHMQINRSCGASFTKALNNACVSIVSPFQASGLATSPRQARQATLCSPGSDRTQAKRNGRKTS